MAAHGRLVLLAIAACLAVARAALPVRNINDCVSSSLLIAAGTVYPSVSQIQRQPIQERTTVSVAQNFEVSYGSTYKVLTHTKGDSKETYVLYQCGTPVPDLALLGLPATTKMFTVPLTAIRAPDTTVLNFMKLLGVQDRVSYVTPYTVDPCMQLLSSSQCGTRTSNAAPADSIDGSFDFGMSNKSTAIMFAATAENGPLLGAEYIKFVAAFFNKEARANQLYTAIYNSYNDLYNAVQSATKSSSDALPVVAWLYYQKAYPDFKLPEQIQIKFHGFRPQYTGDAGGVLPNLDQLKKTYVDNVTVMVDYKGDIQLINLDADATITALRAILAKVDMVIDESYTEGDVTKYTLDSFLARYRLNYTAASTDLPFLANKKLLRLDGTASASGTTAWFEEALARPDVVLHDLVYFITPSVLKAKSDTTPPRLVRSLIAFSGLAAPAGSVNGVTVLASANCPLTASQCGAPAQAICPAVYLDCNGKLVTATEAQPCAPNCAALRQDGAAGRAVVASSLLMALLIVALLAVVGPFCRFL